MIELPEGFDSVFRYIVVVSQRAEQLINGAKPRTEGRHAKPTLAAKDDVDNGQVPWRVLTQEELDAQRQAIVDQFRAEMAGEEFVPQRERPVRDVLPTAADRPVRERAEAVEPAERDDELARLQRLLGMASGQPDEEEEEDEGSGDDDLDDLEDEASLSLDLDEDDEEGELDLDEANEDGSDRDDF